MLKRLPLHLFLSAAPLAAQETLPPGMWTNTCDPERAGSYNSAHPDAALVENNLRGMQGSCARTDEPPIQGDQAASLAAQGDRWRALYEAKNWADLRALYADDAVLMTQGQPRIEGADAIIAFLRRVPDSGGTARFAFENEDISTAPGTGFVTAKYRMTITYPDRDPIIVAGRSFLVYKWQDGAWKLWRDIDNIAPDVTPQSFSD